MNRAVPKRLRVSAVLTLGTVLVVSLIAFTGLRSHLALDTPALVFALAMMCTGFYIVLRGLTLHPHLNFGAANTVTAVRTAIVSLVAATVFFAADLSAVSTTTWTLVGLVLIALILDGVDGYLARLYAQTSALGARFDMEIDALLILVLSAAALILDKAGWWVLGIGLMRYGFVLAQLRLPELGGQLPPSFRRKLICVVQVATLCVVLLPVVVPPVSNLVAFAALVLLSYSFAVDTGYLLRGARLAERDRERDQPGHGGADQA